MKVYHLSIPERDVIKERIRAYLMSREDVLFAYIHGSFLEGRPFRDIDVAVFVRSKPGRFYEMELEDELSGLTGFPVDVRLLNDAPVEFRFHVISGELLFSRDERARCDFEERTMREYHDYSRYLEMYRGEALGI
ncbi:nucleotidyltransferase domain-containing protein [Thermococcus sp. MAR1]|uniref:type VII toxin-antitoxin system MntA family adenylyltransferase antitoxin n=1 Tax=Thermococcus sp. MAR1 TaxID=1638263 RepID=UPI0014397017|nr:nucleotidyltransferase domain-containing protein [Thermococcus sp. MAR1]NJE11154.1 nucleotidyltransferase domain-containing protein [Thermococcus sp. MAR1]